MRATVPILEAAREARFLRANTSVCPAFDRLAHWNVHHRARLRLALGGGTIVFGFAILVTV